MTITKRLSAIAMVFVMLFSFSSTSASAANAVSFRDASSKVYTVKTKKAPWYTFAGQNITIENTGSTSMTIFIYNSNGSMHSNLINLKPGKKHKFSLKANKTYSVQITPHAWSGGRISGYVTSNKYVSSVK